MSVVDHFPYYLILISGPPRSGKSRAGVCLAEWLDADHFALSNMLKRLTHDHFGLGTVLSPLHFEAYKDKPMRQFGGLTPRDAYIMYSETIMKPTHGNSYLGQVGKRRIKSNHENGRISVVSGVGFVDEIRPLIDAVGGLNSLHIKINPVNAKLFEDSREPLDLSHLSVTEIEVENRGCNELLASIQQHLPSIQMK